MGCAFIGSGRIKVEMKLPIQLCEKVGRSTPAQVFASVSSVGVSNSRTRTATPKTPRPSLLPLLCGVARTWARASAFPLIPAARAPAHGCHAVIAFIYPSLSAVQIIAERPVTLHALFPAFLIFPAAFVCSATLPTDARSETGCARATRKARSRVPSLLCSYRQEPTLHTSTTTYCTGKPSPPW